MKVNIIFQNIQLLACFFFWISSTSNLYLAIQSSCRKKRRGEAMTSTAESKTKAYFLGKPACRLCPVTMTASGPFALRGAAWHRGKVSEPGARGRSGRCQSPGEGPVAAVGAATVIATVIFTLQTLSCLTFHYFITTRLQTNHHP